MDLLCSLGIYSNFCKNIEFLKEKKKCFSFRGCFFEAFTEETVFKMLFSIIFPYSEPVLKNKRGIAS